MTPVLLVQGTHGWGRDDAVQWWEKRSAFCTFLQREQLSTLGGDYPFIWSTDLDGVGFFKGKGRRHINWESAGCNLLAYLWPRLSSRFDDYVPLGDRNIIAHSHALQVVAYACAQGLKINRLVTVGSPVRKDMADVYEKARPNIGVWTHVHSDGSDRVQWFGELFDGHLGIVREAPLADRNVLIASVSHSRLLNDKTCFAFWQATGLLSFLKGGALAA